MPIIKKKTNNFGQIPNAHKTLTPTKCPPFENLILTQIFVKNRQKIVIKKFRLSALQAQGLILKVLIAN